MTWLRPGRLKVGLGPGLAAADARTGHGRVWHSVLTELARLPRVKLVDGERADVWLAAATAVPAGRRPLVIQLHEVGWRGELRRFLDPGFAQRLEAAVAAGLEGAAHVITPSLAARDQVVATYGWTRERVHAVPHGVDHERFRPGIPGGREVVGAPYVLSVGVLHSRKNLDAVRAAVDRLARGGLPHVLAAVANPPPDRAEPDDLERRLELPSAPGRVRLRRGVTDSELAALMAGADVFCLPSWFEGFGLPALEAMACGSPVVVSDRGALPELVGEAGLVVTPDPEAVHEALLSILTDPSLERRLRAQSVQRAAQFSWARTAQGWLEVLRQAAAES